VQEAGVNHFATYRPPHPFVAAHEPSCVRVNLSRSDQGTDWENEKATGPLVTASLRCYSQSVRVSSPPSCARARLRWRCPIWLRTTACTCRLSRRYPDQHSRGTGDQDVSGGLTPRRRRIPLGRSFKRWRAPLCPTSLARDRLSVEAGLCPLYLGTLKKRFGGVPPPAPIPSLSASPAGRLKVSKLYTKMQSRRVHPRSALLNKAGALPAELLNRSPWGLGRGVHRSCRSAIATFARMSYPCPSDHS
jgi:hypothetical protein